MSGESKQFRIHNKRIHFVYKSHIPVDVIKSTLTRGENTFKVKVAHEKGKPRDHNVPEGEYDVKHEFSQYEHTHVYVEYSRRLDVTSARAFDVVIDGVVYHPFILPVTTDLHSRRTLKYLDKENPVYDDFPAVAAFDMVGVIEDAKELSYPELLAARGEKIADAVGLSIISRAVKRNQLPTTVVTKLKPWQLTVMGEIMRHITTKDNRSVLWVYDPIGGAGKTELIKYMSVKFAASNKWVSNNSSFTARDLFHSLSKEIEARGSTPSVVAMNVARSKEFKELYEVIESLKDGHFSSEKYDSRNVTMAFSPAVVVFSNKLPECNKLTLNRWKFFVISGDGYKGLSEDVMNMTDLTKLAKVTAKTRHLIEENLNEIIEEQHKKVMDDIKVKTSYAKLIKKIYDMHETSPEMASKVKAAIKSVKV